MGQRLNIEIMDGERVLANAYYHWSAYTSSALALTKQIINISKRFSRKNKLQYAVNLLEGTGAGIHSEERERISIGENKYSGIVFADSKDRNNGLISVTETGIEETRQWEEDRVTIHIDSNTFDFGVFFENNRKEYDEEYQLSSDNMPLVNDFDFNGIRFDNISYLEGFIKAHPDGVRLGESTVIRWIK